jgi:asparagine synthase (glutamine-hydrolysing)
MSALAGMLVFGDGPVDTGLLADLGAGLERLGPDGGREVSCGSVGMAYRAFHTDAESRTEPQPLRARGCRLLTWDGRLDNRDDLMSSLGDERLGRRTDVEIVMAAYARWGTLAVERLEGDFALALWDESRRVLLLARDCVGTRGLFYHVNAARIIWSSDLGSLLNVADLSLEINEEYVAGFFTGGPEPGLTPYVAVRAVKPAHVLRVDSDGLVSQHVYWSLDPDKEIRYKTDAEYEEHFRHLFRDAVRVRLRTDRPAFAELSGGLDSSSIVCMADEIIRTGDADASRLETVSYVFDQSPASSEREWIEYVEIHRGRQGHHIVESQFPYFSPLSDTTHIWTPNYVLFVSGFAVETRRLMAESGARVVLSGMGGDQVLHATNRPAPELSELLSQGRLLQLHRRLLLWSRTIKRPYLDLAWKAALQPLLPPSLSRSAAPLRGKALLADAFIQRTRLRGRLNDVEQLRRFRRPSARDQAAGFLSAVRLISQGYRSELGGAEYSYPFLHRPLIAFLQAIPFEQRLRPGESRSLMRRALRNVLPPKTIARRGKGSPAEAIFRSMGRSLAFVDSLLAHEPELAAFVDVDRAKTALRYATQGFDKNADVLLSALTLTLWLRLLRERRTAPRAPSIAARRLPALDVAAVSPGAV